MTTLHDVGGVLGDGLGMLSFGLSQWHGHDGSWPVCEVALKVGGVGMAGKLGWAGYSTVFHYSTPLYKQQHAYNIIMESADCRGRGGTGEGTSRRGVLSLGGQS